ncbi:hypothetical protein QYM36_013748 [Artemia franciscana]|uniref:Uncharacterized protein n=1 Tax=Artemia franciscana TaxID=6661 RepID=A0AA88HH58_ARTSF|nr:hypothetical protein QYM36_013748 [Artemia franciscana]
MLLFAQTNRIDYEYLLRCLNVEMRDSRQQNFAAILSFVFCVATVMTGVLFIKQGALDTVRLHHKFNQDSFLYSFNYEGRYSLGPFLIGDIPEIPYGE